MRFVLVHGAFQGDWVWQKILPIMKYMGHDVICPNLAGSGRDRCNLTSTIGLDRHIQDVCDVLDEADEKAVLVGHSYGGIVISGVAKKRTEKISTLLYLDSPIPEDNQSLLDVLGEGAEKILVPAQDETGNDWRVEPLPAGAFGLSDPEHGWAIEQHTAQSLKTFTDKVSVAKEDEAPNMRVGYIHCLPGNEFTHKQAERAKSKDWKYYAIQGSHCPMITHPDTLVDLLCKKMSHELSWI